MDSHFIHTPIGLLHICAEDNTIVAISRSLSLFPDEDTVSHTPLLKEACHQISDYFLGKRILFDLPLHPHGTPFQQAVWHVLQQIPYGETRSYKQIAQEIGCPKALRAVGHACHCNPILLAIPCHRVIGSNKSLTGFACGIDIKRYLLEMEQSQDL